MVFRTAEAPQFLVLRRSDRANPYPGLWQVVSGKVESGEKAWEAALRELQEETDIRPLRFYNTPQTNVFYVPADDTVNLSPVFAALVDRSAAVSLSAEHVAHRWLNREAAIARLVWPGQKTAIQTVNDFIALDSLSRTALEIRMPHG